VGEQQYSFLEGGTELSIVHLLTYLGCWGYGIIFIYYSSVVNVIIISSLPKLAVLCNHENGYPIKYPRGPKR